VGLFVILRPAGSVFGVPDIPNLYASVFSDTDFYLYDFPVFGSHYGIGFLFSLRIHNLFSDSS
jgi:hypothetical protein